MWKTGFCVFFIGFMSILGFPRFLVDALYFPTAEVNISLPEWTKLPKPLPPLMILHAVGGELDDINYGVVSESTSGLLFVNGNEVRVNDESFTSEDIVTKQQLVVVSGRSGVEMANATINLFLTRDKINCEKAKRNLCFWKGVSYRIWENQPPTPLGQLSSPFFGTLCKNYNVSYRVFQGEEYMKVSRPENSNSWILSTKKKIKNKNMQKIRFGLNCTVASLQGFDSFLNEFDLIIQRLNVSFEIVSHVTNSNIVRENERIAKGLIRNAGGGKLVFSLVNDTEDALELKCLPMTVGRFHYECDVSTKKALFLKSAYTAVVKIEDASSSPHQFHFHNITLVPVDSGLEKLSLMLSTNEKSSMKNLIMDLKYPESVEVSKRAVVGTRVSEPMVGGTPVNNDDRRRILMSNIKFALLSPGVFNITQNGGIIFVNNRYLLKEGLYRIKITGIYPNGYKFISLMEINVTKPKIADVCEKPIEESVRPSCSEKRFKSECEKTCGVSTGVLKSTTEKPYVTTGCIWRVNEKPEKLSRLYQTCSPDLSTCPDRFCDPLETLFPKICPQDCTEYVFGSANKENHTPGIASATGVCTCKNHEKCLCALMTASNMPKPSDRRKPKEIINDTITSRQKEAISAVKASYTLHCGIGCLLSVILGSLALLFGILAILLVMYRRRLNKRCPNQRPLKEDMVNINYEEYVERPSDILRPLTQTTTMKEIPDYFDKKWEFPRHRLTIEETIGEGEFGKVLKARADGIGGYGGSTTVAVKTLKDNAKESELADLISEFQLLKEIDHPNVIHLLGACTKLDGPLYIIIEYAKYGSLRTYLRKHRHLSSEQPTGKENETSYVQTITPKDILTFAWQIAKGMNYLTDMKLVHRDLAARNVLIADGLICKISDFGLTRDIYEDDTYLKRSKGRVPVKWMALESLADHVYTTKSDVWSYGVVLWELVTTGASPYPGIAGQDLFNLLKSGYRMERPANCSNELYQILRSCWHENPSHRPTFKSLVAKFEEMLGEGKDYLELNPRTAENKTYFSEFLWNDKDEWEDEKINGMFALQFKMFETPKQTCKCPVGKCSCGVEIRYQNEKVTSTRKYENEGMEDTGYVQPTGKPKPVYECLKGSESSQEKLSSDANFNVENTKKDIFDVKKI